MSLVALDPRALEAVTGGRMIPGPAQIDPALIQGVTQLAQAVEAVGAQLAQVKQASAQGMMQLFQQLVMSGGGQSQG